VTKTAIGWKAVVTATLTLCATGARAHHSPTMFDQAQQLTVSGTVRTFQWTNPHCYVQLLVKNGGKEEEWSFEMGSPIYLYNRGWRPRSLKAGDRLTVTFSPLRKGGTAGLLLDARTADGTKVGQR
jgi:hypothetical protein